MRPRPSIASLVLLLTCGAIPTSAQDETRTLLAEQIGRYLGAYHELGQFSGAALVADGGEVVYRGAFGLANADWGVPNDVDTKYRLASVTKQFTAVLVLQLVGEGLLELDAPITRYLPDYPAESGGEVTIHHLLNHTSGIPSYTSRSDYFREQVYRSHAVDDFVAEFCSDPLEFEPGAVYRYNNSGYFLLGAIVEAVTGKSYRAALRERVLDPLGMEDTGLGDSNAVLEKRATGYDHLLGQLRLSRWMDMSSPYAAGGLYSTVGDLWKWDRALRENRVLSEELKERMFTPGFGSYGYGWFLSGARTDAQVTWHSGSMPGVSTIISRAPARGRCVILLGNVSGAPVEEAARAIQGILDGHPPLFPTRSAGRSLALRVLGEGVEAGLAELAEKPPSFKDVLLQQELDGLGHGLLRFERIDEALLLFELNARVFPGSADAWNALGRAQRQAGDLRGARASYRRSLALEPGRAGAEAELEELGAVETWMRTFSAIRLSERYGGLGLRPQEGLLPLGADPGSGLHEFLHLGTHEGAIPERGEGGRIEVSAGTGLIFVLIPGGSFWMGSQGTDPDGRNFDPGSLPNEELREVRIEEPFFLSKYEMTEGQWARSPAASGDAADPTHPIQDVPWSAWVETLGSMGLGLPTEEEWEYAARAGTSSPWVGGTVREEGIAAWGNIRAPRSAGAEVDGYEGVAPVGRFRANAFGLHDVLGNVWEWTAGTHVNRGGSFLGNAAFARVAFSGTRGTEHRGNGIGARPRREVRLD